MNLVIRAISEGVGFLGPSWLGFLLNAMPQS